MEHDDVFIGMIVGITNHKYHMATGGFTEEKVRLGRVTELQCHNDEEYAGEDEDGFEQYEEYEYWVVEIEDDEGNTDQYCIDDLYLWEECDIGNTKLKNENHKL